MHRLSIHDRKSNERVTILANAHCIDDSTMENEKSSIELSMDDARFRTFTKSKMKENRTSILANVLPQRYFDSPTMIEFDEEIPLARCSQRTSQNATVDRSFDESELFDFTNPNRALSESMRVISSRHPSLDDLKYINEISSVLINHDQEEHIYQELVRINPTVNALSIDENKENRPPLLPIDLPRPEKNKVFTKKNSSKSKPNLIDILNDWSTVLPEIKELLNKTRQLPLRLPNFPPNSMEFRRLKQLINEFELIGSSWNNSINHCRSVLQHAQQLSRR